MKAEVVTVSHLYTANEIAKLTSEGRPFMLTVDVSIRPDGEHEGADLFYLNVCNFEYVVEEISRSGAFWERDVLVVARWDWDHIERAVRERVKQVEGSDWDSVARELCGWLHWEFDGYVVRPQ